MKILLPVDDSEANRAEHDAIVVAWNTYGTGQILNDNAGIDNQAWFHNIIHGPDIRVSISSVTDAIASHEYVERPGAGVSRRRGKYQEDQDVRDWCEQNGFPLGFKNRISIEGLRAYRAAHQGKGRQT
jgi:hypothetical protein